MKKQQIAQRLAFSADLPDALTPGMPLVEIAGENRVLIENHLGVSQFGQECICVKVKYGQVCISGCGLELARMTKGQLVITGSVDCVSLVRGCR